MQTKAATYLDYNAGGPLHPAVVHGLIALLKEQSFSLANPSSVHYHGRQAKRHLAEAREHVARSLGPQTDPEQLIFTSSGTEANQLAINSALTESLQQRKPTHWIVSPTEHHSTLQMAEKFRSFGVQIDFLQVDSHGVPIFSSLENLIKPETTLVSTMWVNNETGAVTNLEPISQLTRKNKISLHVDAAQAWGKLPVDLRNLGADFVSFSGHKIGALAGTGVLWINRGITIHPLIQSYQEKGRRGGTENLLGIISMGLAAQTLKPDHWAKQLNPLRELLEKEVVRLIPGTKVNAQATTRIANTSNFTFEHIEGDSMSMALDMEGFSVSAGSACSSGVLEPSHVLLAMGKTKGEALASLRVSLHLSSTHESIQLFAQSLSKIVDRSQNASRTLSQRP